MEVDHLTSVWLPRLGAAAGELRRWSLKPPLKPCLLIVHKGRQGTEKDYDGNQHHSGTANRVPQFSDFILTPPSQV